jgi:hypothetical protein
MYKIFEFLPFGFTPKGEEVVSICLRMVFRVHIHSNDEPNLQDIDINDNFEDQNMSKNRLIMKRRTL